MKYRSSLMEPSGVFRCPACSAELSVGVMVSETRRKQTDEERALLAEIKRSNKLFHGVVVAQARNFRIQGDTLVLEFDPRQRTLPSQATARAAWLADLSSRVLGRRLTLVCVLAGGKDA